MLSYPANIWRNKSKTTNLMLAHYGTSNIGDITKSFCERDPEDSVQIIELWRTIGWILVGNLFTLECHTLKKRLHISIDYVTNKMPDDYAQEFFDTLKENLTTLALS